MSEWDKYKNYLDDIKPENCCYLRVKVLIREGDKLQDLEKKHYEYALDANKRLGDCNQKLNLIRKLCDESNKVIEYQGGIQYVIPVYLIADILDSDDSKGDKRNE